MDVCLVASGLVLDRPGWLDRLRARTGTDGQPAAIAGGAVIDPTGLIRQAGYFFSLFRRLWGARLGRVPEVDARRPARRCCARSAPSCSSSAASGSRPSASTTSCSRARTPRWTTACASPRPAASASSSRASAPAAWSIVDGEPDDLLPAASRLRVKHVGVSFQQWAPEVI